MLLVQSSRAAVAVILFGFTLAAAQGAPAPSSPWSIEKRDALVRIEVPVDDTKSVGSGFIVEGLGGNFYVVTASHTLLPKASTVQPTIAGCENLLNDTILQEQLGNAALTSTCVKHLGHDVSIIRLAPRSTPYRALKLNAADVTVDQWLFLGGFPASTGRDTSRKGQVTTTALKDTDDIVVSLQTAEGFSGGPYLDVDGNATAVHRAGKPEAALALAVPLWQIRSKLEEILGAPIDDTKASAGARDTVRRNILVLQYQPTSQVDALEEFLSVFRQKITALPGSFKFATEERLGELRITSVKETLSPAEQTARWKANSSSLMLMSGTIFSSYNPRLVTSSITVGEKNDLFPVDWINTQIAITPEQALTARDSHTVMLLYALAKDAYARKAPNAIVAGYLAEAQETAKDLAVADPTHFKPLLNAISKTLAGLK